MIRVWGLILEEKDSYEKLTRTYWDILAATAGLILATVNRISRSFWFYILLKDKRVITV